jgi:hypothetical protein
VQLTELLFQKVKDLPAQGQLALKPGYVAVVSRSPSLRAALIAPICPSPDDQKRLSDPPGPTRVGVGVLGGNGTPYRLLRELGGSRQLLKFNPESRKYAALTDDQLEIDSFLRVECGMPTLDAYTHFFVLEVNELPSLRARSAAAVSEVYVDAEQVRALKEELVLTQTFEGMQDRLFKIATRLQELSSVSARLREAETDADLSEHELTRSPWSKEQIADLTARARRAPEELKRREDGLAEIASKKQKMADAAAETPPAQKFVANPWFGGGIAGGVVLDLIAFFAKRPSIALAGLLPYLGALIAVLRWIEADEEAKESVARERELKTREHSLVKNYELEHAPLRNALKAANLAQPADLIALFEEREAVSQRRDQALARLVELRKDPEIARAAVEVPQLEEEKQKLDSEVLRMGFTRSVGDIEADLKRAMGVSGARSKSTDVPEAEVPKQVLDRAGELLAVHPDELFQQIGPRLSAYLGALTDQRVTTAKRDEKGLLVLAAGDGRSGPYTSLPPPLRDLVYTALRLALVERVATMKKLPVIIDDAFGVLEPGKRALVAKMLKGISTQAQVVHRVIEPPPPGTADLVLQT